VRNVGTCIAMQREKLKRPTRKSPNTEAWCRGGVARSSVESPVMGRERRRDIVRLYRKINRQREESFA
jgi:hypothetical protein